MRACKQTLLALMLQLNVCIIQFFIGWLSRRLTQSHIWYVSCCFSFFYNNTFVWHCRFESQWTTYQCVILFIYHLSGSGVSHLNICWLSVFFLICLLHSVCLLKLLWFHKTTTHNANCNHLRSTISISITNGNYLRNRHYVCVCAHKTKKNVRITIVARKICKTEIYKTWFHANAKINWTTMKIYRKIVQLS